MTNIYTIAAVQALNPQHQVCEKDGSEAEVEYIP
jgi:hypothetical protein